MKYYLVAVFIILAICISPSISKASTEDPSVSPRTIVHLLDYIAQDYDAAVADGTVINEEEFQEMLEFSETIESLSKEINFKNPDDSLFVFQQIEALKMLIRDKSSHEKIVAATSPIKKVIISTTGIKVSPTEWPDLSKGLVLYQRNCSSCHGPNGFGDGPLAQNMDPMPTSFHEKKIDGISPFQAFNTIRLGVSGTSMPAFDALTDQEAWDLAFYIKSLKYENGKNDELAKKLISDEALTLENIAFLSDYGLEQVINSNEVDKQAAIGAIRNFNNAGKSRNFLALASQYVKEAAKFYENGDKKAARNRALQAYLEGIEPVELQIKASHPAFLIELESKMTALRQEIEKEASVDEVLAAADVALEFIQEASEIIKGNEYSFWLTFFLAASVIIREGIEAFLIIVTILGIIRVSNAPKAQKWVHFGWIAAVVLGVAGWFVADNIINISGAEREILEGTVALLAACLLLYIGFWLHSKAEIGKWNAFVKEKVHKILHGGNMLALSLFSFIVVFREAFESVLFLSALNLEVESGSKSAIGLGVVVSFLIVLALSWLFLKFTAKMPIIKMLKFSSIMIALLAVVLVGKGVHALQETGLFSITAFPVNVRLDILGVYPTMETMAAQIAVLIFIVVLYQWKFVASKPSKISSPKRTKTVI